jgi:tetratricopeptide (TPR) repeat protein
VTRAELDDERAFLLRSIEDLDRERAAGDLSEEDHASLRDQYTARAAEVLRALDDTPAGDQAHDAPRAPLRPPRDRAHAPRRSLLVAGGVALFAAAAGTVVAAQSGSRLPGQTSSGTVSLAQSRQLRVTLAQAETLESRGDGAGALRLYHQVLASEPNQVEALAESGWLEFEAGVRAKDGAVLLAAQQLEERATRADPGAYAPHLYLGSMLLAEGDAHDAVGQYHLFLAEHPPTARVYAAAPFIERAFTAVGQVVPALPGAPSPPPSG